MFSYHSKKAISAPFSKPLPTALPRRSFFSSNSKHPRDNHPYAKNTYPSIGWILLNQFSMMSAVVKSVKGYYRIGGLLSVPYGAQGPALRSIIPKQQNQTIIGLLGPKSGPTTPVLHAYPSPTKQLCRDYGFAAHMAYPWYLTRTLFPTIPKKTWPLYSYHATMNARLQIRRMRWGIFLVGLSVAHDMYLLSGLMNDQIDKQIYAQSIIPMADALWTNKKTANQQALHDRELTYHLMAARSFASLAAKEGSKQDVLITEFVKSQHKVLSSLLFSFYRTPVTETIRSQLIEGISNASHPALKLTRFLNKKHSNLEQVPAITLTTLLNSPPTKYHEQIAKAMKNDLDTPTYQGLLLHELSQLACLRSGYEKLIKHHTQTTLLTSAYQLPTTVVNFRYVEPRLYDVFVDPPKSLTITNQFAIDTFDTIFKESPIGHLNNITSPDLQLAIDQGVPFPAVSLYYAACLANPKSVLSDMLPPQHDITSKYTTPNQSTLTSTQQLIPADLLQLYPVIPGDNKSLPLNQTLLLIDLSMGLLLSEYQRTGGVITHKQQINVPMNNAIDPQQLLHQFQGQPPPQNPHVPIQPQQQELQQQQQQQQQQLHQQQFLSQFRPQGQTIQTNTPQQSMMMQDFNQNQSIIPIAPVTSGFNPYSPQLAPYTSSPSSSLAQPLKTAGDSVESDKKSE
jgi:hypothetical protein